MSEIINYRGVKNLNVSRDVIPTLKFQSRLYIQTVVLRYSKVRQYMRIVGTKERKCRTKQKVGKRSLIICIYS